jgi:hypothetical protein
MSSQFPSKETVEHLRKRYPEGTSVELVFMDDPYSKLVLGDRGKVTFVDDTGTIFVNWDKGSGLGIVFGQDSIKIIEEKVVNPLAASEMSTEQNYDMIDGLHNNISVDSVSVLEQLREHKKTTPVSHKQNSGRDSAELEL